MKVNENFQRCFFEMYYSEQEELFITCISFWIYKNDVYRPIDIK